jgi:membrane protein DedA with SNARE-associated domain
MSATDVVRLLDQFAFVIIPALVVAEQFGIPVPAVPALLGFGALAAHERGNIPLMLATLAAVALAVDSGWYEFGRRRGAHALGRLCRLTLEPDSCIRRAHTVFERFGIGAMLVSKFVPGLTTILPPLAGIFGVGWLRFAVFEIGGTLFWAGLWMSLGYAFSDAVAMIGNRVAEFGLDIAIVIGVGFGSYVLVKYVRRRIFFRKLRTARIAPEELKRKLDAGEDVTIVDLRTRPEVLAMPRAIPGSLWMSVDELDAHEAKLLQAGELVVYCS